MSELSFTILDASDASLNKTAVLITGPTEAVVVDAAFTRADAHRIVAAVLDSGKTLTAVLVTAGDPDFSFGAEVLADAFPDARLLAPADVIEHIDHSYEGKLAAWAHLGQNLPTRKVRLTPFEGSLTVDGEELQLTHVSEELGDRGWVVLAPSAHAIVGGVLLFEGLHVWTADSATPASRQAWLEALDRLDALQPTFVAAGHRTAGAPTDTTAIEHTREYLRRFEEIVTDAPTAEDAEQQLLATYPDAGMRLAASLGTKVAKGELTWA